MSNARGDSIGASTPDGLNTVTHFALKVGVSPDTIRRWCREGHLEPITTQQRGQLEVRLFSDDQIEQARQLATQPGHLAERMSDDGD